MDEGEPLKRPPRGYDAEHPLVEDLKRRTYTSSVTFTDARACASDFPTRFVRACKSRAPLMKFLSEALGHHF